MTRKCGSAPGSRFRCTTQPANDAWPLARPVACEQHDERAEGRHYLGLDVLATSQTVDATPTEEANEQVPQAL